MSRARFTASLIVGSLLLVSVPAFAQGQPGQADKPQFGDAGQFALSLNEGFIVNETDIINGSQVQANYFVIPHLSLGLMIGAQWLSVPPIAGGSSSEFVFRVGPRVGYDIPLSDYVSIWPQLGVDYRRDDQSTSQVQVQGGTTTTISTSNTAQAFGFMSAIPVLIHPTKGFFIGAGPFLYSEFSNSTNRGGTSADNSKITSVGLLAMIGGAI